MVKDVVLASLITPEESDFPFTPFKQAEFSVTTQISESESLTPPELDQEFNQTFIFWGVIVNQETFAESTLFKKKVVSEIESILEEHSYCLPKEAKSC